MVQIAIRCLPRVPIPAEEIERWLRREIDRLRDELPQGMVRLSSLTQHLPSADIDVGWLIELEFPHEEPLEGRDLEVVLGDMQLLGLQPTLLTPADGFGNQDPEPEMVVSTHRHPDPPGRSSTHGERNRNPLQLPVDHSGRPQGDRHPQRSARSA